MLRTLAFPLAAGLALGLALPAAAWANAVEDFPVNRKDAITIRVLNGRNGQPQGRLHLILIGGYDPQDLRDQFYREEVISDVHGQVRLSRQLENLPWLQVWVQKKKLCQAQPRTASFNVDLIRRDGLSTPNHCGLAAVEDSPGVFTVFVKGGRAPFKSNRGRVKHKRKQPDATVSDLASAPASTPLPTAPQPAPAAAPAASCACPPAKKTTKTAAVCNRVGNFVDGFAKAFR